MIAMMQHVGHQDQKHLIIPYGIAGYQIRVYDASQEALAEWIWELLFDADKFFPHPDKKIYHRTHVTVSDDGRTITYDNSGLVFDLSRISSEYTIGSYRYFLTDVSAIPQTEYIEVFLPHSLVRFITQRDYFEDETRMTVSFTPVNGIVGRDGYAYTLNQSEILYIPKPCLRHIVRSIWFKLHRSDEKWTSELIKKYLLGYYPDAHILNYCDYIGKYASMEEYAFFPEGKLYLKDSISYSNNRNTISLNYDGLVYDLNNPHLNRIVLSH